MLPFIQFGEIIIPSYFLLISLAFCLSTLWIYKRADNSGLDTKVALDLCLVIMLSSFVGARLFHVIYEHPQHYINNPIEVFKFWQGGFVFYGGLITALGFAWVYLRKKNPGFRTWLNIITPPFALGYIIGRFATLLSGSGYGRPTDLPWGITYPVGPEAPAGVALHPTPIYSMLWHGLGLLLLYYFEKNKHRFAHLNKPGHLLYFYLCWYAMGRMIVEQFRDDFRGNLILGFSVSTVISLAALGLGLFLLAPLKKHD